METAIIHRIKNFIQLHTAETDDREYIAIMRGIAEWANDQAEETECREDNSLEIPNDY